MTIQELTDYLKKIRELATFDSEELKFLDWLDDNLIDVNTQGVN